MILHNLAGSGSDDSDSSEVPESEAEEEATGIFGVSLAACMKVQQIKSPGSTVPQIIPTLIRAIVEKDGLKEEGLFRLSANKEELDQKRQQYHAGDYDRNFSSAHVPACLLKMWLRELPQPIIPEKMYEAAIGCVQDATKDTHKQYLQTRVLGVWADLDTTRQHIVSHLASLVQEMCQPDNAATNKMSFEALAIVFAPSFLKNPSLDYTNMMQKVKLEIEFVRLLLEVLPTQHLRRGLLKSQPCKFGLMCQDAGCPYDHRSPYESPEKGTLATATASSSSNAIKLSSSRSNSDIPFLAVTNLPPLQPESSLSPKSLPTAHSPRTATNDASTSSSGSAPKPTTSATAKAAATKRVTSTASKPTPSTTNTTMPTARPSANPARPSLRAIPDPSNARPEPSAAPFSSLPSKSQPFKKKSTSPDITKRIPRAGRQILKILIVGNASCGKTSIIRRYVTDSFEKEYITTVGADYNSKTIQWADGTEVQLQLWDIAGQDRYARMTRPYFQGAHAAVVVCDVTRGASIDAVKDWKDDIDVNLIDIPVVLVANKCDLLADGAEGMMVGAKLQELCSQMNFVSWHIISAKKDMNLNEAFNELIKATLAKKWENQNKQYIKYITLLN